jgi:glycerophosphoryl diester phosphodiesterase
MTTRPLLLGHRGARAHKSVAENTLASFDLCLAHGCDGFEFDVRLSADGEAVICHDAKTSGMNIAQTRVRDLNLPTLHEVLERYSRRAFLDIELKVPGLERHTSTLLRQFPPKRGLVVSSFLPEVLVALHAESPQIPLGLICENKRQFAEWKRLPSGFVMLHQRLATQAAIHEITAAGQQVFVWTVNRESAMRRFIQQGVAGLISDQTALLGTLRASEHD